MTQKPCLPFCKHPLEVLSPINFVKFQVSIFLGIPHFSRLHTISHTQNGARSAAFEVRSRHWLGETFIKIRIVCKARSSNFYSWL